MQIKTYKGQTTQAKPGEIVFYIQSHGLHAGRPLTAPIANCWEVITARSIDFEICCIVFESRILENFILGSVIPFIRLSEYRNLMQKILSNAAHDSETLNAKYLQLRKLQELHTVTVQKLEVFRKMQKTICRDAIKHYKPETF